MKNPIYNNQRSDEFNSQIQSFPSWIFFFGVSNILFVILIIFFSGMLISFPAEIKKTVKINETPDKELYIRLNVEHGINKYFRKGQSVNISLYIHSTDKIGEINESITEINNDSITISLSQDLVTTTGQIIKPNSIHHIQAIVNFKYDESLFDRLKRSL